MFDNINNYIWFDLFLTVCGLILYRYLIPFVNILL